MIKVVLDTNVLLSGLMSKNPQSPPLQIFKAIGVQVTPYFSSQTFEELEQKLQHPKLRKYIPRERGLGFLADLKFAAEYVEIDGSLKICRDPKDNMVLETALLAGAGVLVSGDEDLLVLSDTFEPQILTPRQFVSGYL